MDSAGHRRRVVVLMSCWLTAVSIGICGFPAHPRVLLWAALAALPTIYRRLAARTW